MTLELAEIAAAWPLGASLAAALTVGGLREGRRRSALNEALHELRRPLQVLALVAPPALGRDREAAESPLHLASAALERLEREINGESMAPRSAPLPVRPLLAAAIGRWRSRAALAGGSLRLRWDGGEVTVDGDRCALAQALDNLIVNAIEHGGPEVEVSGTVRRDRLLIVVSDRDRGRGNGPGNDRDHDGWYGRADRDHDGWYGGADRDHDGRCGGAGGPRLSARHGRPVGLLARLSGRRRRGHGLRVVRRTVAAHGGEFRLRCDRRRTEAIIELPLPSGVEAVA